MNLRSVCRAGMVIAYPYGFKALTGLLLKPLALVSSEATSAFETQSDFSYGYPLPVAEQDSSVRL